MKILPFSILFVIPLQRLGKILGSPPDASESLAESVGDGAEVARRAPAFDGANPSAYLAANQEGTTFYMVLYLKVWNCFPLIKDYNFYSCFAELRAS